jgi:DNA polymerase-3 subunit epsilon
MRQIVLDTETTGLEPEQGHRVIEIGAVEMLDRRLTGQNFHAYLNPDRDIEAGALEVHGITGEFLSDKPRFGEVAEEFLAFIEGAELIIHNAPFDLAFLDYEYSLLGQPSDDFSRERAVIDTLVLARELRPGQRNNLDALCKAYEVDNANRTLHGALLDAEILADVYLAMTGGQVSLGLSIDAQPPAGAHTDPLLAVTEHPAVRVLRASGAERAAHDAFLEAIARQSESGCLWRELEEAG